VALTVANNGHFDNQTAPPFKVSLII